MKKDITKHIFTTENKTVNVFINTNEEKALPVIYANMHSEIGDEIITECSKLGCKPFHLVSITGLNWDEDLSPWQCGQVVSKDDNFTGKADLYMKVLRDEIIPWAESLINDTISQPARRIISGYSMGGLFALYVPYITNIFSDVISVSGSLWFPDFISFAKENKFARKPNAIYMSLGDKESKTKNKYLKTTQDVTVELCKLYKSAGINTVFELNPGNHFTDVSLRIAKGITWMLSNS